MMNCAHFASIKEEISSHRTQAFLPQIILVNADSNCRFYIKYLRMSQSRNIMEYNVFQKESIFNFLIKCYVMSINYTVHLYLVNFYEAGFLGAGPGQSSEN